MNKSLSPIGDSVQRVLKDLGVTPDTQALFLIWEKEAGNIACACSDVHIRKGILYITLESPAYIQELALKKRELLRKINGHFPHKIVQDIRSILT